MRGERLVHHLWRAAIKRLLTRQHLVQDDPSGIEIGPQIYGAIPPELLGRHIGESANNRSVLRLRLRFCLVFESCDAETCDLGSTVKGKDDVRWLDVPMNYLPCMAVREATEDVLHQTYNARHRNWL